MIWTKVGGRIVGDPIVKAQWRCTNCSTCELLRNVGFPTKREKRLVPVKFGDNDRSSGVFHQR